MPLQGSYISAPRFSRFLNENELNDKPLKQCGESVIRCFNFIQFCGVCLFSLITVVTPWTLFITELIIMLTIYLTVSDISTITNDVYSLDYRRNFKDILILSILRVVFLSVSYGMGSGRLSHKPYYCIATFSSIIMIPYVIAKAIVTELKPLGSAISLLTTSAIFSVLHIIVARSTVIRTTRRVNLGLVHIDYPWDSNKTSWTMQQQQYHSQQQESSETLIEDNNEFLFDFDKDMPRERLADSDSFFVDVHGVSIHYKEAYPIDTYVKVNNSFAVILLHGFGGGVFVWRKLLQPLADDCGCRVVAFDRPAFGLTSRPETVEDIFNPYKLESQKTLVLDFCKAIGLKRIIMVAHGDGCLLTLMIAAYTNQMIYSRIREKELSRKKSNFSYSRSLNSMKPDDYVETKHSVGRKLSFDITQSKQLYHHFNISGSSSSLNENISNMSLHDKNTEINAHSFINPNSHVVVHAIVLLHPDLSVDEGTSFTNLLMQSKLGRNFLRPLIRSDIGQVSNRRAWYDVSKLTKEILDLYKAPLHIHGWDSALIEYSRAKRHMTQDDVREVMNRVIGMPSLVITGEKDRIVPPEKAIGIADEIRAANICVLSDCGHISHEEVPDALLDKLKGFIDQICQTFE